MSLNTALEFAKNASEEKVPFRFQFPVHTKKEFEALCEKYGVSMTDMILGLIQSAIDEDKGIMEVATLNIVQKIEKLEEQYKNLDDVYRKTGDAVLETVDGAVHYILDDMESIELKIKALKRELAKRSENE